MKVLTIKLLKSEIDAGKQSYCRTKASVYNNESIRDFKNDIDVNFLQILK